MSPFRPEVVFWNLLPYRTTKRVHQCMAYPLSQLFYPYVGIIQIRSQVEAIQADRLREEVLQDTSAPIRAFLDRKKAERFLNSPKDYGKPWYGQLMAGPQMIAYVLQINYWMKKYQIQIKL